MTFPNRTDSADARDRKTMLGPVLAAEHDVSTPPGEEKASMLLPPLLVRGWAGGAEEEGSTAPETPDRHRARPAPEDPRLQEPGSNDPLLPSVEGRSEEEARVWSNVEADATGHRPADSPSTSGLDTLDGTGSEDAPPEPPPSEREPFQAATAEADVGEPMAFGTDPDEDDAFEADGHRDGFAWQESPVQDASEDDYNGDVSSAVEGAERLVDDAFGADAAGSRDVVVEGEPLPPWGTSEVEASEPAPSSGPEEMVGEPWLAGPFDGEQSGAAQVSGEPIADDRRPDAGYGETTAAHDTDADPEEGSVVGGPAAVSFDEAGAPADGWRGSGGERDDHGLIADDEALEGARDGVLREPIRSDVEDISAVPAGWSDDLPQPAIGEPIAEDEMPLGDPDATVTRGVAVDPVGDLLHARGADRIADRLEAIARQLRQDGASSLIRGKPDSLRALIAGYVLGTEESDDEASSRG